MEALMEIVNYVKPHWPFVFVMSALWLMGHFMETSVFTKARCDKGWFWHWGRESMELHPLLAGALIGFVWQNPEHVDPAWTWQESVGYFAFAGVCSLGFWWFLTKVVLPWVAKKFGVNVGDLRLPGESDPPGPPPAAGA